MQPRENLRKQCHIPIAMQAAGAADVGYIGAYVTVMSPGQIGYLIPGVHEQLVAHGADTFIPPWDLPRIYPRVNSSPVSVLPETATGQLRNSGNIGPDVHEESSPVSISVPALAHGVSAGGVC